MSALKTIQSSPRVLVAAIAGTLVLLVAGTYLLLISPSQTRSSDLDSQIANANSQLVLRQHAPKHVKIDFGAQERHSVIAVPDTTAMPQVILELSRVAKEVDVSVDSIAPSTSLGTYPGYVSVPISLIVSGSFFAVEKFLKELREQVTVDKNGVVGSTGRLFDVQGVSFNTTDTGVTANLSVNVFVYQATAPAAAAPTTTPAT